jgi:hypothetical protein
MINKAFIQYFIPIREGFESDGRQHGFGVTAAGGALAGQGLCFGKEIEQLTLTGYRGVTILTCKLLESTSSRR